MKSLYQIFNNIVQYSEYSETLHLAQREIEQLKNLYDHPKYSSGEPINPSHLKIQSELLPSIISGITSKKITPLQAASCMSSITPEWLIPLIDDNSDIVCDKCGTILKPGDIYFLLNGEIVCDECMDGWINIHIEKVPGEIIFEEVK